MNPFHGKSYGEALDFLAHRYGDRIGLRYHGCDWSFSRIRNEVDAASGRLAAMDLPVGSRIALWMPNRPEFIWYWMGAAQMGLIPVILNARLTLPEASYQINQSGSAALIVTGHTQARDFLADARTLFQEAQTAGSTSALRTVLHFEPSQGNEDGFIYVPELPPRPDLSRQTDPSVGGLILYTSGTTALPKGVVINHAVWRKAHDISVIGRNRPDDILYLGIPLFSSMAMLNGILPVWVSGGCVHLHDRFDARECLAAVQTDGITMLHLLPAIVHDILALGPFVAPPMSSIRVGLALTADPKVLSRAEDELGIRSVVAGYGMTETLTLVSRPVPDEPRAVRHTTQGYALPDMEVTIRDPETDAVLPPRQSGQICVRGYSLMMEYFAKPAETAASRTADGWFKTGDQGWLDDNGRLIFEQRLGDGYKSRGFNVSAAEVEKAILEYPGISSAAVVGMPHPRDGMTGVAFVTVQAGPAVVDVDGLSDFLTQRLASYKRPSRIVVVDTLPTTAGTAKIQKFKLRELLASSDPNLPDKSTPC